MENQDLNSLKTQSLFLEFITGHGYPVEVYDNIITEDGYILTAFRIPHGRTNKNDLPKPVVMLMHGIATNSADFVIPGPERGLGFVLSDNGYDVWLPNLRGKMGSRSHLKFNSEVDALYWKFSFHEMGIYDLPAVLNQIETITGLQRIAFVGHSLGTVLPLVLLCERPEFNERFDLLINMSPVAIMANMRSIPYKILQFAYPIWMPVMLITGKLEFPARFIVKCFSFLKSYTPFLHLFTLALYSLHGKTPEQFIKEDLPVMLQFYPDYSSGFVFGHLRHLYRTGMFRKFDYGHWQNLEKYGTSDTPLYDLKKVVAPVVLVSSSGDLVAHPKDVCVLYNQLPNSIGLHNIEDPIFNHTDFLYGKNANTIIYPIVLDYLKTYSVI